MLYIVGLGIYDENDLSLRAVCALRKCKRVYAEFYTSPVSVDIRKLEGIIGRKVEVLERKQVEEENVVVDSAEKADTGFVVPGDALCATTHIGIALECRKRNIPFRVIHGSSVFSAVAECGLQLYKFGRTVSLPFFKENYAPASPYENISKNLKDGLHTLILLDIGMSANVGMRELLALEERLGGGVIDGNLMVVCVAHLGCDEGALIKYGRIKELVETDFGALPHAIVIPGKMHFAEEEYLGGFYEH